MKAELNGSGDIVITPETATERYALQAWSNERQPGLIAGRFVIDLTPPPRAPSMPKDSKYIKEF